MASIDISILPNLYLKQSVFGQIDSFSYYVDHNPKKAMKTLYFQYAILINYLVLMLQAVLILVKSIQDGHLKMDKLVM